MNEDEPKTALNTPTAPHFHDVARALTEAGVRVLVLRGKAADPKAAYGFGDRKFEFLIPRRQVARAVDVLEPFHWRYAWLRTGLLRLLPKAYYWWDGGTDISLYWSLPATPMPAITLKRLTEELWTGAKRTPEGFLEPEAAALLVHLAVQACRPGRGHEDDWKHFLQLRGRILDWAHVREIAGVAGVSRAVRRAVTAADLGGERPGAGPLFDGPVDLVWRAALALDRRVRPARMRRLLIGAPSLGDFTMRCRIRGAEVHTRPGVFVPTPDADIFVDMTLEWIGGHDATTIVEIGTGCGAIALALARSLRDADVYGTDLALGAVRSARENARRLGLERAHFVQGSVLDPLPSSLHRRVDVIIANLPFYPPEHYASIGAVPRGTIQGSGRDGLDLLRQLARGAHQFLRPGGLLVLQMFAAQWESFSLELRELGYRPDTPRYSGRFAICPAELNAGPTNDPVRPGWTSAIG